MSATSSVPATRRKKTERLVAEVEATEFHTAIVSELNAPDNWRYCDSTGEWINIMTGEISPKAPSGACHDLLLPLPNRDALTIDEDIDEEETCFSLTSAQISAGISLAIEKDTGEIRRCPECGKRRLVSLIRDDHRWIVCADSLAAEPTCNYYRVQHNK